MNLRLPEIETDLDLWLSVLADNELVAGQRARLSRYLDNHPEHWRECAVALMDQQAIESHWDQPDHRESIVPACSGQKAISPVTGSWLRRNLRPLVAVAALVLALASGVVIGDVRNNSINQNLMSSLAESNDNARLLSELLIARQQTRADNTLYNLYPDSPLMIEIENTNDRAVFLTDRPVSDAMLESFLAAGHQIEINPYAPRLQTRWLSSLKNPVLAVEVKKYNSHLIAQGDIR